jgi:hypothetical protein
LVKNNYLNMRIYSSFGLKWFVSVILTIHAYISILLYLNFLGDYPEKIIFEYLLFSFVVFSITIFYYSYNFLFMIRIGFLGLMGLAPMIAVYLGGYFAFRSTFSQTHEISFLMLLLSNVAIFSAHFGFLLSEKTKVIKKNIFTNFNSLTVVAVFIITMLLAYIIGVEKGGLIFNVNYGEPDGAKDMPIKNLSVITNLSVFILVFYYFLSKHKGRYSHGYLLMIIISCVYLYLWNELFRGARMDPLSGVLALIIITRAYTTEKFNLNLKQVAIFVSLFLFIQVWGYVRISIIDGINFERIISILTMDNARFKDGIEVLFFQGTLNNLYLTISTTIYAIQNNMIDYWHGSSYLDYILRTPPQFMYPDRPESLAWLPNKIFGDQTSAGGYTELAEVFLNFGIWGGLIIPGIISYYIGYSMKLFVLNKYSLFYAIPFFSILSVYFRGNLYQTFVFYKALISCYVFYMIIKFFNSLILIKR